MTRAALAAACACAIGTAAATAPATAPTPAKVKPAKVDGRGIAWWVQRARANKRAVLWQKQRVRALERELRPVRENVTDAIVYVFGPYASQALRVAYCESRYSVYAANGQYLGLFQMGDFARARYGHGASAWAQAVSAYRYFADSGYSWGPWSCKP